MKSNQKHFSPIGLDRKKQSPISNATAWLRLRTAYAARLLPLLLLLLALPALVESQDYTYTTNNGTITITAYYGANGAVTIPDTINGLPVTSIGDDAFWNCTRLTTVTIPNSVTNIGIINAKAGTASGTWRWHIRGTDAQDGDGNGTWSANRMW